MLETKLINNYFARLTNRHCQLILNMYDDYVQMEDPILGKINGSRVKNLVNLISQDNLSIHFFDYTIVDVNVFNATVKWKVRFMTSEERLPFYTRGSTQFEFKELKIVSLKNSYNILPILNCVYGKVALFPGMIFWLKRKLKRKLLRDISMSANRKAGFSLSNDLITLWPKI